MTCYYFRPVWRSVKKEGSGSRQGKKRKPHPTVSNLESGQYTLKILCSLLNLYHTLFVDGRDPLPVCGACFEEVSRTGKDPSDGATFPRKLTCLKEHFIMSSLMQSHNSSSANTVEV